MKRIASLFITLFISATSVSSAFACQNPYETASQLPLDQLVIQMQKAAGQCKAEIDNLTNASAALTKYVTDQKNTNAILHPKNKNAKCYDKILTEITNQSNNDMKNLKTTLQSITVGKDSFDRPYSILGLCNQNDSNCKSTDSKFHDLCKFSGNYPTCQDYSKETNVKTTVPSYYQMTSNGTPANQALAKRVINCTK